MHRITIPDPMAYLLIIIVVALVIMAILTMLGGRACACGDFSQINSGLAPSPVISNP